MDLNKANGKLDAKSEVNIPFPRPIDIVRPASTDGPPQVEKTLIIGFEPRSLPSHSNHPPMPPLRRPKSGDWTPLASSMEHLSLESLKEPSVASSANGSTTTARRHTVALRPQEIENKVPARTQAAIEKVAEIVNKMGGQIRTHVQDNGGTSHSRRRVNSRRNVGCVWI